MNHPSSSPHRPLHPFILWLILILAFTSLVLRLQDTLDFSRDGFDILMTGGLGFLGLALFLLLAWQRVKSNPPRPAPGAWLAGFLLILILTVIINLVVDPYSRFGSRPFPRLVVAMSLKVDAYRQQAVRPQLVILGSSRALTVSPAYIQGELGIPAFNFAGLGASTENLLIFTRFILAQGDLPEVLLVEISPPLERGEGAVAERTPAALFPYLPPDLLLLTLQQDWSATFNIHGLSDASFLVLRQAWLGPMEDEVRFDSSGLINGMAGSIGQADIPHCTTLDPTGLENLQELIDLARQYNTAIVFYQSPRHPDLYERMMADPAYVSCQQAFEQAMQAFDEAYPEVFFLPYMQLESINILGEEGFFDPQHVTFLGAKAVVEAALPTLQEALDWAVSLRSQP